MGWLDEISNASEVRSYFPRSEQRINRVALSRLTVSPFGLCVVLDFMDSNNEATLEKSPRILEVVFSMTGAFVPGTATSIPRIENPTVRLMDVSRLTREGSETSVEIHKKRFKMFVDSLIVMDIEFDTVVVEVISNSSRQQRLRVQDYRGTEIEPTVGERHKKTKPI